MSTHTTKNREQEGEAQAGRAHLAPSISPHLPLLFSLRLQLRHDLGGGGGWWEGRSSKRREEKEREGKGGGGGGTSGDKNGGERGLCRKVIILGKWVPGGGVLAHNSDRASFIIPLLKLIIPPVASRHRESLGRRKLKNFCSSP
jgi:hypothetical protein